MKPVGANNIRPENVKKSERANVIRPYNIVIASAGPQSNIKSQDYKMKKILMKIMATIKFVLFMLWIAAQIPLALALAPFGHRAGIWQFKFFTRVVLKLAGIRVKIFGKLSPARPLLIVGNHISVFEFMTLPASFGASFFAKDDVAKMPVVGPFAKFWGVVMVSRKPSAAAKMAELIANQMQRTSWPMVIYPEGTTSNGSVVLPFKSSMFDFIEKGADVTVQPIVMFYRDSKGNPIDDQVMADDYAYFDNAKMPPGACLCKKERSAFGQVFHVFELGGFTVEFHLLPPPTFAGATAGKPPLAGMDRKQIAETLHKIVNDEFMKLKDMKNEQNGNNAHAGGRF